jgi:hypothetical protein
MHLPRSFKEKSRPKAALNLNLIIVDQVAAKAKPFFLVRR